MKKFDKILFPVDLSDVSPFIASWVIHMAEISNAEVHLIYVARRFEHFVNVYVSNESIDSFEREVLDGAERKLNEFVETKFRGGENCYTSVKLGDAAEEILEYSKLNGMDLIIMGTHGRKGLERILFGSVADTVVKNATVPVMTINPHRVLADDEKREAKKES